MFEGLKEELARQSQWRETWQLIQEARDRIAEGRCSEVVKRLIAEQRRSQREFEYAGA
jgi:hypothetical protein